MKRSENCELCSQQNKFYGYSSVVTSYKFCTFIIDIVTEQLEPMDDYVHVYRNIDKTDDAD